MDKLKEYLSFLQEEIFGGMVPFQIAKLGSREIWLINFNFGKYIRRKWFKYAFYLEIADPKELKEQNGNSAAVVRHMQLHTRHFDKNQIIDSGECHIKWRIRPSITGWFATGSVFDIFDFTDSETLQSNMRFRIRIQTKEDEEERTSDAIISRVE